jgi:gamma-glutamylcyclotransferase (GGCT)/AIG2-like uncharacterized protein YtfP
MDYLNFFELLAMLLAKKQVRKDILLDMFNYWIDLLPRYPWIWDYVESQGFENLASLMSTKLGVRPGDVREVFVYGTLLPGAGNSQAWRLGENVDPLGAGKVRRSLVQLGAYPGLRLGSTLDPGVHGEIFVLGDVERLSELDEYEGCGEEDSQTPEFERMLLDVETDGGITHRAWGYVYRGELEG